MKTKLNVYTLVASLGGIGFIPFAPGTFGSLAAFGLYLLLPGFLQYEQCLYALPLAVLGVSLFSVVMASKAEESLGHDAGSIVIDELCGYFVAAMFLPHSWLIGLYAFAMFRVFDIAKPWPVSVSQKLPRGWGVVIDDLLAGIYANLSLQILIRIYPRFFGL
ncbi:MAG TPA: phosphatidylglycerophosphatase A [Candidatus Cloacimonadota bacterium]|nr:phosphatidylglycerophosphatase A [Candidatus Cloacimonadota bacterium]